MQHAFGLAGRAGGVQDEQRIFRIHRLRRANIVYRHDFHVVPQVAPGLHFNRVASAVHHHHCLHRLCSGGLQRLIDIGFQQNRLAAAHARIGGDDHFGLAVFNPAGQRIRRKAAEDHAMHRADAGAGQHGDGRFRHHRHVQHHAVAFAHAMLFQHIGKAAGFSMQLFKGNDFMP